MAARLVCYEWSLDHVSFNMFSFNSVQHVECNMFPDVESNMLPRVCWAKAIS